MTTTSSTIRQRIHRVARERFGFERLRPGQEEAIVSVLERRDTLAVMATGSGKSAIYQLAGLLTDGPTIVISPLIALQRDQSQSIRDQDMADAAVVNSSVRASVVRSAFEDLKEGDLEFVFLAPEQFTNEETLARVKRARPSLFVVDEAHCISEWGHQFRPDYLRLGTVVKELGHPTVLALTATAAPLVREEIVERLGMRKPRIIVRGFDRPNIRFSVTSFETEADKKRALLERVAESAKPGIVYVGTRKQAEEIAEALTEAGVQAASYHAGMKAAEREEVQQAFMSDETEHAEVIVATTAFGMGVNKADVRFVFHYQISESPDAYYQEIGRAGRDGKPAEAVLFYRPEDLALRRFFSGTGRVNEDQVKQVADALKDRDTPAAVEDVQEDTALSRAKVTTALRGLEDAGVVESSPTGDVRLADHADADQGAELAAAEQERRRIRDLLRIEAMRGYAEAPTCRRRYLLAYFGEALDAPCGRCDRCEAGQGASPPMPKHRPFPVKSWVKHRQFGPGLVIGYEGKNDLVVLFERVGYKTLAADAAADSKVLQPLERLE
jgi:ATP-dependent DNA helicase RecQ